MSKKMDAAVRTCLDLGAFQHLRILALECRINITTVTFLLGKLTGLTHFDALCIDSSPGDQVVWSTEVQLPELQQLCLVAGKSHLRVSDLNLSDLRSVLPNLLYLKVYNFTTHDPASFCPQKIFPYLTDIELSNNGFLVAPKFSFPFNLSRLEVSRMRHLEEDLIRPSQFPPTFPSLRALNLAGTSFTHQTLYSLLLPCPNTGYIPELESLNLDDATSIPFSVPLYHSITAGTNALFTLRSLSLKGHVNAVNDQTAHLFKEFRNLAMLGVQNTPITSIGLRRLLERYPGDRPLRVIKVSGCLGLNWNDVRWLLAQETKTWAVTLRPYPEFRTRRECKEFAYMRIVDTDGLDSAAFEYFDYRPMREEDRAYEVVQ
ncbi:hypothetical protein BJ508DRAFT_126088 [Ascobolus immersus RN42]|uniref:RNI-like protein n=1 Tax=Ascobolus immersus RN42 TaxID=1160509 RepID=A0A3N4I399_ASCIM|nr:hypothetical protein BJ508DRAFT_126088 [Ascobolus immersus RN42]